MSEFLKKEQILFKRGEDGQLLPEEIILETLDDKPKIKYLPITYGKFQELKSGLGADMQTSKEQDTKLILEHCLEPKLVEEEVKSLKPKEASAIVLAIISGSLGINQKDTKKQTTGQTLQNKEVELKKN